MRRSPLIWSLATAALVAGAADARAATIPVTTTEDATIVDGRCSLREAVLAPRASSSSRRSRTACSATTYHCRVVAESLYRTATGEDSTFPTPAMPPPGTGDTTRARAHRRRLPPEALARARERRSP